MPEMTLKRVQVAQGAPFILKDWEEIVRTDVEVTGRGEIFFHLTILTPYEAGHSGRPPLSARRNVGEIAGIEDEGRPYSGRASGDGAE